MTIIFYKFPDMADAFIELAESKGLKAETIEALQEQGIDNVDDLALLGDDDVGQLMLNLAQANRLKKWIKDIKREFNSYYQSLRFFSSASRMAAELF